MSIAYIFVVLIFGTSLAAADQTLFSYTDGKFTMLERMNISMEITYFKTDNTSGKATVLFPQTATVDQESSTISAKKATLVLDLGEMQVTNLTQNFEASNDTFSMKSMSLGLTFDEDVFPMAKDVDALIEFSSEQFETPLGSSYSCNAAVTVESEKMAGATNATLTFTYMQLQPFGVKDNKFSEAISCPEDKPTTTPVTTTVTTAKTPGVTTVMTTNVTTVMTTVMTTPAPKVFANQLNFTSGGKSCILEFMNATFQVDEVVDKKKVSHTFPMVDAKVLPKSSKCDNKTKKIPAVLAAEWKHEDKPCNITQTFVLEKDSYRLMNVTVFLTEKKYEYTFDLPKQFLKTKLGNSLKCDSDQVATYVGNESNLTMTFSEVRFQAFDIQKSNFSKEANCPADNPTPIPEPQWSNTIEVTYPKNDTLCIKEVTNATFEVNDKGKKIVFNMTGASVVESASSCGDKTAKTNAVVAARWGDNTITQTFVIKDDHYYMQNVSFYLKRDKAVYNHSFGLDDDTLFYTPFGSCLFCKSEVSTNLKIKDNLTITMTYSNVIFQAYDINATVGNFTTKQYTCPADNKMSNIVPIAVGAALAVLVIIVLIAYLIGRRNSSRAGYESV